MKIGFTDNKYKLFLTLNTMPTSKVIYLGELRTKATHLLSQNSIITDAPLDNHGKGEAFSPTDLTATSLASCMMTLMGIYANNHNISIKNMEAEVTKVMSIEGPRRIVEIGVNINVQLGGEYSDNQLKAIENAGRTCPVSKSLHPEIKQNLNFKFE